MRHRRIVIAAAVLTPILALLLSLWQKPLYEAAANVLLSRQNLATSLTGTADPTLYLQAERLAQTQADLARMPDVAERAVSAVPDSGITAERLLGNSDVSARQNADILEFRVRAGNKRLAAQLATEYARQFTLFRRELDTAALERAREEVEAEIGELEASGQQTTPLYTSLRDKEQQLQTMEALQTSNAFVVREATDAVQVQPRFLRNAVLGAAVGLALGVVLAFLAHAFDTRVRSAEEIGVQLGLPLLARIPDAPKLRGENQLAMAHDPGGLQAEAFRMLRTNLEFVNLERGARVIMVTSAVQSEGKSTTIANLALALARSGRRVILVDLDLRRPILDRLFGLQGRPGVTDVALGHETLDRAIAWLGLSRKTRLKGAGNGDGNGNDDGNGNGNTHVDAVLGVLPAGPLPPDVGEFAGSNTLARIIAGVSQRADVVLIDAPPLLNVGDGLALSARVDALLVVTRLKVVRQGMLGELRRLLDTSRTPALGFVVTDAAEEEGYGRGYGYGYGYGYGHGHSERSPAPSDPVTEPIA
jgi:Mrp family chromosome partitioning ATPase